jgi:hypothetical protein
MTSWPLVIERVTASSVPSAVTHTSRTSTNAVIRDVGMMGLPSSSRGNAMKSGKDSRPPESLHTSSNHCKRRRCPHTKAAITPSTRKSVMSNSPSQQGYEHWPTSRDRGGGARWRRSGDLLPNRLAAARVRSLRRWRRGNYCPAAGILCLGTFWIEDAISGSLRDHVSSNANEGRAVESCSSGSGGSCRTERSHSGRAGEPFVDERLQRGERKGPGPQARRRDGRDQTRSDVTGRDGS